MRVPCTPGPRRGGATHPESCGRAAGALFPPVGVSLPPSSGRQPTLEARAVWSGHCGRLVPKIGLRDHRKSEKEEEGGERKAGPHASPPRVSWWRRGAGGGFVGGRSGATLSAGAATVI